MSMVKQIKIFGSIFLILLLQSCSEKAENKILFPKTIHLNLTDICDSLNLSEIAEKVEYVPLQTVDNALLSSILNFSVTDDYFFIKNESDVMIFDKKGKYLSNLFVVGNGPGEAFAYCFTVDNQGKYVYVYDHRKRDVKSYSFSGDFKGTISGFSPKEYHVYAMGFFNNNLLVHTTQRPYVRYLYSCFDLETDSVRILCRNYREYNKSHEGKSPLSPHDYHFQVTDTSILYKETYCDTLFEVHKDFKQEARYIIDLGNNKLFWEDWRDSGMFNFATNDLPSGYKVQSFVETKSFFFIVLKSLKEPPLLAILDKQSNSVRILRNQDTSSRQIYLNNDIDSLIPFPFMNQIGYIFYFDGWLYSIVEAKDFEKYYKSASAKIKASMKSLNDMPSTYTEITEFSNPVIMKVYLK